MEEHGPDATDASPVVDRPDSGGFAGAWWPLVALAVISVLLMRACIDASSPAPRAATPVPAALQMDKTG
ncbi:MAG: hypothetical protein ACK4V1_07405 [Burkholderiaceae bacterium]